MLHMDSIKEFEQMEFFNLVDVEDFINSKPKDELDNYSFILGEINKVKRFLKYTNRNINNVYLKYYLEMEYFYFDGIFIFNLNLNVDENEFDGYKEYFLKMEERYLKSYEMGKISNLVAVIDKRLRVFIYRKFYDRLSEEERFKGFIYIYKSCENAQQAF